MGQDGNPQRRRITVGLSDGVATEVVDGNLQEGEMVITGQNVSSASAHADTQAAPGFGGAAPRMGGGGGGRQVTKRFSQYKIRNSESEATGSPTLSRSADRVQSEHEIAERH